MVILLLSMCPKTFVFRFFLGIDIEWIFSFRHFLAKNCIFRDQKMAKILRLPNFSLQILLVSSPDYHPVVITFLRYGGACMWVNFNFHFQIKSLMLLCERCWRANFMKFEPKCQKFILVSIPIIAKSIYAAKTAHKLQIWTLVENLGPKRQILAQNWTLKIMVTMATGPFMLWFCEIGPPRLSKYWVWKKLKTHYKMTLVRSIKMLVLKVLKARASGPGQTLFSSTLSEGGPP